MLYTEFKYSFNSFPLGIRFESRVDTPNHPYKLIISSVASTSPAALLLEPGNGLLRIGDIDVRYSSLDHINMLLKLVKFPINITFAIPIEDKTGLEQSFGGPNTNSVQDQLAVINMLERQQSPITTLPQRPATGMINMQNTLPNQIPNTDIVNVNDLKKSIYNIDGRFRQNINITSSSDFSFGLDSPIKNVIRVKLASFEFPLFYYSFSAVKGNTSFDIILADKTYIISIPDGSYDLNGGQTVVITDLVKAINKSIGLVGNDLSGNPTYYFNCNYSDLTGVVTIGIYVAGQSPIPANYSPTSFTLDFTNCKFSNRQADWGLGYNLGYRSKSYSGKNHYNSETFINITSDPYLFLILNDFTNLEHKLDDGGILNAFAKFQLTSANNTIVFIDSIHLLYREIIFQNPQNINEFKIRIADCYGETVDLRTANLSMAFEVTQVMNGELYDFYRNYLFQKNNMV